MSEHTYIPVNEVPRGDDIHGDDILSWDFELPSSVDAERVVVDYDNLAKIQRAASFRSSHVYSYQGETTQYTPSISGASSDGTATAGSTAHITIAETQQSELLDDHPHDRKIMQNYGQTRTLHALNKAEIASDISDIRRRKDISREEAWAKVLNASLGESLRDTSKQHLMDRGHTILKAAYVGVYGYNGANIAMNDFEPIAVTSTAVGMAIVGAAVVGFESMKNVSEHGESLLSERRLSMLAYIGDFQPEKYIATNALTRALPVIRCRD